MSYRPSTLLADLFSAFASPAAQRNGVTFPADLTALWAEALREVVRDIRALEDGYALATHERDQLLAIAQEIDVVAFAKAGRLRPVQRDGNVIDLGPILRREMPTPGGAA